MVTTKIFFVGPQLSRECLKEILASAALTWIGGSRTLAEAHGALGDDHGDRERADILLLAHDFMQRYADAAGKRRSTRLQAT